MSNRAPVPIPPAARAVAEAVLYEGYVLYPYRTSSAKNRVRWQFGVLAPRPWIERQGPVADGVAGSTESWWQQTECLLEAPDDAVVHVRPRFLQSQQKVVQAPTACGWRGVDRLDLDDRRESTFDEAVPHEGAVTAPLAELFHDEHAAPLEVPAGRDTCVLTDRDGRERGRVVRTRQALSARVRVSAWRVAAPFPLVRLRIRVENAAEDAPADLDRPRALRRALLSTHCFVAVDRGRFCSLLDPPAWAAHAARDCVNVRTFPVLVGAESAADLVLSAPIILYDHVQVAPESPGDLHDATEIDEILSLRTLTLTDEEKREARGTDPRAGAIVDRIDSMPPEALQRLHGAIRSLRPVVDPDRGATALDRPAVPWWEPGADASVSPETDAVLVDGVAVSKGSRVRLRPRRRGSDAHDMFLAGRTARVQAVFLDVDDARHVAVTIEDDPSAELHQWYGRFHYFAPEEIEALPDEGPMP